MKIQIYWRSSAQLITRSPRQKESNIRAAPKCCPLYHPRFVAFVAGMMVVANIVNGQSTIRVPADYPTIQAALNAASVLTNDTILVSPGVYAESVNFNGKAALLISANGAAETLINPPAGSSAITFSSGETSNSVVSGFTITNGGIYVNLSSPTIISNLIVNCGTGVNSVAGSPNIINNVIIGGSAGDNAPYGSGSGINLFGEGAAVIQGNVIQSNAGGIAMWSAGTPTIVNNLIQNNQGDGIGMVNLSNPNIIQNVITGNAGDGIDAFVGSGVRGPWAINNTIVGNDGAGIYIGGWPGSCELVNNIVTGDPALNVSPWYQNGPPIMQFNDFYSAEGNVYEGGVVTNLHGIDGNISTDPFFACLSSSDFRLLAGSPCIDAGTNGAPDLPALDFDGNPRILAGKTNNAPTVDMGSYVAIHRSAILFYKKLKTDSSLGSGGIQEERRDRLPAEIGADGLMHPVIGGALL